MPEFATLYAARPIPLSMEEVRLIAGTRDVRIERAATDEQIVVRWPEQSARLTALPSSEVASHLQGFTRYVESSLVMREPGLLERIARTKHVVGVVMEPSGDGERCEVLLRAACELSEALLFRDGAVFDAAGRVVAEAERGDDGDSDDRVGTRDLADEEDEELQPPSAERVARRALVLCAVVLRGVLETHAHDDAARAKLTEVRDWVVARGLDSELEPHERALLDTPLGEAQRRDIVNATWRSEGLAVLAWMLGARELPAHDESVDPALCANALGFLAGPGVESVLDHPKLRSAKELDGMQRRLLGIHWRLRDFALQPRAMDFRVFAKDSWFGGFDLEGIPLAGDDLAIDGAPMAEASADAVRRASSIAMERHQAVNWLAGYSPVYSEVDTST